MVFVVIGGSSDHIRSYMPGHIFECLAKARTLNTGVRLKGHSFWGRDISSTLEEKPSPHPSPSLKVVTHNPEVLPLPCDQALSSEPGLI